MQTLVRTFATAAALVAFVAPSLTAQKQAADSDEKEIASYRLTMDAVKKFQVAVRHMADVAKNDPEIRAHVKLQAAVDSLRNKEELTESEQARLEKLEQQLEKAEEGEMDANETLSQMAERVTKAPGLAVGLRRAGMTPREFLVFSFALFQASAFAEMKKSGMIKEIPKEANAANVKFAEDHAAELKLLNEEMERINKQFKKG